MSDDVVGSVIGLVAGCTGVWFASWRVFVLFDPLDTPVLRALYEWGWRWCVVALPLAAVLGLITGAFR